jgi:glycosyltransferase A (GT-A) superfamily protein (DUF2064 family)
LKQFTNHTALIFFSRTAAAEASCKQLLNGGTKQNYKAVDVLIQSSRKVAEKSGVPLFIFTENQQKGNSFGEKLSTSVQSVFDKGFDKLIIIGNDCPQLTAQNIQQAAFQLETFDQVLAPTRKGGAYLIGLTQKTFNKETFTTVRWQSSFAYNDLEKLFSFSVFHLPVLDDVNDFADLRKQIFYLSKIDSLSIYLISIIASILKYSARIVYLNSPFSVRFLFRLKAPPFLLS